jgi:hypothetical protein
MNHEVGLQMIGSEGFGIGGNHGRMSPFCKPKAKRRGVSENAVF